VPERKITGFHQDQQHHWVADLECGHTQHVRHNPPWINRPWVVTLRGRNARLGTPLICKKCDSLAESADQTQASAELDHSS
jgi:hypothetical protein